MTDEELRFECLKLAAKHFDPAHNGIGSISEDALVILVPRIANEYVSYVKTGVPIKTKDEN